MSHVTTDLAHALTTVQRPGDFFASDTFELLPPAVDIDGFGPLALPVLPDQAARLIAAATPAPFGRGGDTVLDTRVRRTWQVPPDRVRISGKRWSSTLEAVVRRAAEGLGAGPDVKAEFYKLLVYDAGSFFVGHRDTEKSPGMFATLVIALPSMSTGGDLVVRHAGREARLDLRSDDPAEAKFAAFYADCLHEVLPVETGCRVTLVYNLVRDGRPPEPPRYDKEEDAVVALLEAWRAAAPPDDGPQPAKIVYPLAHAYTPAELSFGALKGADAAAAGVLAAASPRAACDLQLALLVIEESGSAEPQFSGRWDEHEDDYEMSEVFDRSDTLTAWRGRNGRTPALGDMPVAEDEYAPPDACDAMIPDEQNFHEATGNEGASMDRTYRRAALVIWPTAAFLPMIAAAGLPVAMPYLSDLAARHRRGGDDAATLARDWDVLARAVIARWPERFWGRDEHETTAATALLDAIAAFQASGLLRQFLMRPDGADGRNKADNRALIDALAILPAGERGRVLEHLIEDGGPAQVGTSADLLARAADAWPDTAASALGQAARSLVAACPTDDNRATGYVDRSLDHVAVAQFLSGLARIDDGVAVEGCRALLDAPKVFDMDARLIPALLDLISDPGVARSSAYATLRIACVGHLDRRIAKPLAPPADWSRANALTCACPDRTALSAFLADPACSTWTLKAAQPARSHVETTIANSRCDVDTQTVRQGSPHRLAVTKNQASYDRLAAQRRSDLDILARIDATVNAASSDGPAP